MPAGPLPSGPDDERPVSVTRRELHELYCLLLVYDRQRILQALRIVRELRERE